jgi:hypothetical protein
MPFPDWTAVCADDVHRCLRDDLAQPATYQRVSLQAVVDAVTVRETIEETAIRAIVGPASPPSASAAGPLVAPVGEQRWFLLWDEEVPALQSGQRARVVWQDTIFDIVEQHHGAATGLIAVRGETPPRTRW